MTSTTPHIRPISTDATPASLFIQQGLSHWLVISRDDGRIKHRADTKEAAAQWSRNPNQPSPPRK